METDILASASASKTFYGLEEEEEVCSSSDSPNLPDESIPDSSKLVEANEGPQSGCSSPAGKSKSETRRRGRPRKRSVQSSLRLNNAKRRSIDIITMLTEDAEKEEIMMPVPPPPPPAKPTKEKKPVAPAKPKKLPVQKPKLKKVTKPLPAKKKAVKSIMLSNYMKAFNKKAKLTNQTKTAANGLKEDGNSNNAVNGGDLPAGESEKSATDDFPLMFLDEMRGAKVGALKAIMTQKSQRKAAPGSRNGNNSQQPAADKTLAQKRTKAADTSKSALARAKAAVKKKTDVKNGGPKEVRNDARAAEKTTSVSGQSTDGNIIEFISNFQSVEVECSSLPSEMPPAPVFDYLEANLLLCDDASSRESKTIRCMCAPTAEQLRSGRGCGDDCLNRQLFMECGSRCPSGKFCTNKQFQRRQYADLEIFPAGLKGWGLRARAPIAKGQFIIEYVGEVVDGYEKARRIKRYGKDPRHKHHYFMALRNDAVIDATAKGNLSRFINHSCDPNAVTQKWSVNRQLRVGFFALRAIAPGEEIVFNYQFERYGKKAQICYCNSSNCTGFIGGQNASQSEEEEDVDEDLSSESASSDSSDSEYETSTTKKTASAAKKAASVQKIQKSVPSAPSVSRVTAEKDNVEKTIARIKKEKSAIQLAKRIEMEREKKKAMEMAEVSEMLNKGPLRTKEDVLEFNRLMVRVDQAESRKRMIEFLLQVGDYEVLRMFVQNQGLGLLRIWFVMPDTAESKTLKMRNNIVRLLLRLPIENQQQIDEASILPNLKHVKDNKLSDEAIAEDVLMDVVYKTSLRDTPSHLNKRPDSLIVEHANLQLNLQKVLKKWNELSLFKPPKKNELDSNTDMVIDSDDEHSETPPISSVASSHYHQYMSISKGVNPSNGFKSQIFSMDSKFKNYNNLGGEKPIPTITPRPRPSRFSTAYNRPSITSSAPIANQAAALPPPGLVFPLPPPSHLPMAVTALPPPVVLFHPPPMNMLMNMTAGASFFPPPPPPPEEKRQKVVTKLEDIPEPLATTTPQSSFNSPDDFQLTKDSWRSRLTNSNLEMEKDDCRQSLSAFSVGDLNLSQPSASGSYIREDPVDDTDDAMEEENEAEAISIDGPPHPPPLKPCNLSSAKAIDTYIGSLHGYIGSLHEYIASLRKYNARKTESTDYSVEISAYSSGSKCSSRPQFTTKCSVIAESLKAEATEFNMEIDLKTEPSQCMMETQSASSVTTNNIIDNNNVADKNNSDLANEPKRKRAGETITPPEDPLNEVSETATIPKSQPSMKVPSKSGKWYSSTDSDGNRYYFHIETQESVWDLPEDERIPEPEVEKAAENEDRNSTVTKEEEASFLSEAEQKRYVFKRHVSDFVSKQLQAYRKRFFVDNDDFIQFIRKVTRKVLDSQDKSNQDLKFTESVRVNTKRLVDEYIRIFKVSRTAVNSVASLSSSSGHHHHRHSSVSVPKRRLPSQIIDSASIKSECSDTQSSICL